MYRCILFDLDGTLTDPSKGITSCIRFALDALDIYISPDDPLTDFIGPPLKDHFIERLGVSEETADALLMKYRERYAPVGIYENRLYDGIPELLDDLRAAGRKIALATCKPEPFAAKILEHFDILKYFDAVCGATLDGTVTYKAQVVADALEKLGVTDRDEALMVGDRADDVIGAEKCGISTLGARWGFADEHELERAGAAYVADTVEAAHILLHGL